MSHLQLLHTPSSGVDEVVKALQSAHAYPTRTATPARLRRHFGPRTSLADITTALGAAVTAGYASVSTGKYKLTDAGHRHAHLAPARYASVS